MKLKELFKNNPIQESTFFKDKLNLFKNNDYITILKNPSSQTLISLLNKGDIRGLYVSYEDNFYFWDAKLLNHYGFSTKFGFGDDEGDINFILNKNSILFPIWMMYPETYGITDEEKLENIKYDKEIILNNKIINKLYPNGYKIGVSY